MTCHEDNQITTAKDYIQSLMPNVSVSKVAMNGTLIDAGIDAEMPYEELTEKQRDLALAYLILRVFFTPSTTQSVTDRDADWEHSEGSAKWSYAQLRNYLILARDLLAKWGIEDPRVESLAPKWGMKGSGFHKIRRYTRRSCRK